MFAQTHVVVTHRQTDTYTHTAGRWHRLIKLLCERGRGRGTDWWLSPASPPPLALSANPFSVLWWIIFVFPLHSLKVCPSLICWATKLANALFSGRRRSKGDILNPRNLSHKYTHWHWCWQLQNNPTSENCLCSVGLNSLVSYSECLLFWAGFLWQVIPSDLCAVLWCLHTHKHCAYCPFPPVCLNSLVLSHKGVFNASRH